MSDSGFKSFDDLERLFALCHERSVTRFRLGDLEVEFAVEPKVLDLFDDPKDLDKQAESDTPYERALKRSAGVSNGEE